MKQTGSRSVVLGLVFGGSVVVLIQIYFYLESRRRRPRRLPSLEGGGGGGGGGRVHQYDVCIVGAGPAGSSCAYYLASAGVRVLLLERESFPRDKICGDVLPAEVHSLLKKMGVWQRIMDRGAFRWLNVVGLVGSDVAENSVTGVVRDQRPLSVQRIVLDEELAAAACGAGATLHERCHVTGVHFEADGDDAMWRVLCSNGREYTARILVAADGANSGIAKMVGVVTDAPNAWGQRCHVRPQDAFQFKADYVLHYGDAGPLSIVRQVEDFIICSRFRRDGTEDQDGLVLSKVLRTQNLTGWSACAPMRVGGVEKCFGPQFLCVGDAAGQCDPLTGHGILNGMTAAKMAAVSIVEALVDDGPISLAEYQARVKRELVVSYKISQTVANLLRRFPLVLKATISLVKRRGAMYFSEFLASYHGSSQFFVNPSVWGMVLLEAFWLSMRR